MSLTTYFTVWHYLAVIVCFVLFLLLVILSLQQSKRNTVLAMIFSSFLVMSLVAVFIVMALDKYTKKAEISKLDNRRMLMSEKIVYTGYVTNVGDYPIGEVTIEFKLVNRGHVTGNVKGGSYFKPSGFFDFFGGDSQRSNRAQKIVENVVVARDLPPGKSQFFNVSIDYPAYFEQVAHFQRIFAH
jgi:hypothetical protein